MLKPCLALVVVASLLSSPIAVAELIPANPWHLTSTATELYNRAENIGEPIELNMELVQWIDVDDGIEGVRSTIGLSRAGRLFQVVEFLNPDGVRRIARLLSGDRVIKTFYKTETNHILAVDSKDQVLLFDGSQWGQSPVRQLAREGLGIWGASTAVLVLGIFGFNFEAAMQNPTGFAIVSAVTSAGIALNTALVKALRFNSLNESPDGFRETGVTFTSSGALEADWQRVKAARNLGNVGTSWRPGCQSSFLPSLPRNLRNPVTE